MTKPTRLTRDMIDEYMACGYWDEVSIAEILKSNAMHYPSKEAIVEIE